jgi:hypothetical protein
MLKMVENKILKIADVNGTDILLDTQNNSLVVGNKIVEETEGMVTLENYTDVARGIWHTEKITWTEIQI